MRCWVLQFVFMMSFAFQVLPGCFLESSQVRTPALDLNVSHTPSDPLIQLVSALSDLGLYPSNQRLVLRTLLIVLVEIRLFVP